MVTHIKVHPSTSYHILLVDNEELPVELNALKLTIGFQKWLVHLPSYWLFNQATSLFGHLTKQWFHTWYKTTFIWKASWGLPQRVTHCIPTLTKIIFDAIQHVFFPKERNSFHLAGNRLDHLHLKFFFELWMWVVIKAPLTKKSLLVSTPQIIGLPLELVGGWLSQFNRDKK